MIISKDKSLHNIVMPVAQEYQSDLVLVSSGFDASDGDPVGDCSVHPETYGHLLFLANGKVCIVIEVDCYGGYSWESNANAEKRN